MRCEHCGKENREDAKFCLSCGMRVQSLAQGRLADELEAEMSAPMTEQSVLMTEWSVPAAKPRKERDLRKIKKTIFLSAVALIVVAAAVFAWKWFTRDKYVAENAYQIFCDENGNAVVVYNDKMIMDGMERAEILSRSRDGKTAVIYVEVDDERRLYAASEGNWTELCQIEDDYYGYYSQAVVAGSGKAVAYYTVEDDVRSLYYYDCKEEKTTYIGELDAENCVLGISPNGKYVVYQAEDGVYRWKDGASKRLCDEEGTPQFVNDKGVTYVKMDGKLYSYDKNADRTKVLTSDDQTISIQDCNRTGSQVIFLADGEFYFSENGKKAEKIGGDTDEIDYCWSIGNGDISDLREQIYYGYSYRDGNSEVMLFFLTKGLELEPVLDDVSYYSRAYDNSGLYAVTEEGKLYSINTKNGEKERLAKDVEEMAAAGKGIVYYINEDRECYKVKNGKETLVSEECEDMIGTDDGGVLFINEDQDLYKADKRGKKTLIAEEVAGVYREGKYFYYYESTPDGKNPVYVSKDGKSFTRIEGVYE